MKVRFIGTGSAINTDRLSSAVLIGDSILVDAPPGINQRLLREGFELQRLDHVLISHWHGDHVFGLPFLFLEYMLQPRTDRLNVYGPADIEDKIHSLVKLAFPKSNPTQLLIPAQLNFVVIYDRLRFKVEDFKVTALSVPHGRTETYGFIFEASDHRRLFYAPDIDDIEAVSTALDECHIAILDATTASFAIPGHTSLEQLSDMATLRPNLKIFAVHRSKYAFDATRLPFNLIVPDDGDFAD